MKMAREWKIDVIFKSINYNVVIPFEVLSASIPLQPLCYLPLPAILVSVMRPMRSESINQQC